MKPKHLYGLLGQKLGHSFSPTYFNHKFDVEGLNARYTTFELADIAEFPALWHTHPHLRGVNVTVPYKQAVIPFLDRLSSVAQKVNAVNTISLEPDGSLMGHNTDVYGFSESLATLLGNYPAKQAIIIGTGGAAQAVKYALAHTFRIPRPLVVSRQPQPGQLGYPDLGQLRPEDFDIVIQATPVGMAPQVSDCVDFPFHILTARHFVLDLIYNPTETTFLQRAAARGAHTQNGLPMLFWQAEGAWSIWARGQ